jgi:signal transduction histidine kinase
MPTWSVNIIFLANSALLAVLGYLLIANRKTTLTQLFCLATSGLAVWSFCVFLVEERLFTNFLSEIVRVQLLAALVFGNGLYYFCLNYPVHQPNRVHAINLAVLAVIAVLLLFTKQVSHAELVNGEVVFFDGQLGFLLYTVYALALALLMTNQLYRAWKRYPELRGRIKYFIAGFAIFAGCASTFNTVLPLFGNYSFLLVGRLSGTIAALFFFFAVAKHEFLDITVIINKYAAWCITLLLLVGVVFLLDSLAGNDVEEKMVAAIVSTLIAAVCAQPVQKFLLTTAKRRFVRGWYSTEEIFSQLAKKLTQEKNREAIFKEVAATVDRVMELEDITSIVAVRDKDEKFSYYKAVGTFVRIRPDHPLIRAFHERYEVCQAGEIDKDAIEQAEGVGIVVSKGAIMMPLHSPEGLEGLLILGKKSSGATFTEADIQFFNSLTSFLNPVLYRLTPMETLENYYNQSRAKLHEAEIQLIRAQKIESIVHATRQCHHEIRTPLNIIRLGIGRIKSLEDLENYKKVAREEIDHALEIVDETLAISDISKPLDKKDADININDVVQRCLRLVDQSRYSVMMDLGELPKIKAKFSDIQVVLTNLIHNAMDAMPNGGKLAFSTLANEEFVTITVEDNGEGIADELKARVWEPYFSGKGGAAGNSTAGRGWGLTIVNRIINEHKGSIRFTSEVNVGTRFVINLPIGDRKETDDEAVVRLVAL